MKTKIENKKKPSLSAHSEEGTNMGNQPITTIYSISYTCYKVNRQIFDIGLLNKLIYICRLYAALCSAHDGRVHSLSVKIADGSGLLRCFVGCQPNKIINLLRLLIAALFFNGAQNLYHLKNRRGFGTNLLAFLNSGERKDVSGIKRVHFNFPAVISTNTTCFVDGRSPPAIIQVFIRTLF